MILLSFDEALAEARRIQAAPDADLARATTALSVRGICSLAVLAIQLDTIAQAAAAFSIADRDLDAWATLQEHLVAAGYLPLKNIPATKEARDGAR